MYSFQSPFAYAANNPIYYIDYMGLGPKEWWESIRGWFRDKILNQTPRAGLQRVKPEKETREVTLTENTVVYPGSSRVTSNEEGVDVFHWEFEEPIKPPHFSSFDYSNRKHVKGQGVVLNRRYPGIQITQDRKKIFGGTKRVVIGPPDDFRTRRVFNPIRRFLGLNMGNRMNVSFNGVYPSAPAHQWEATAIRSIYYQKVLRMHGTHAYFRELERAGIIESFD